MKRRSFLKQAAAFASAPAMPIKIAANPLPVSAEAYAKAVHWAGLWVHSSPATYRNILGVDAATSKAVFARLQSDGILGTANKIGVARAVRPHYEIAEVAARIKRAMAKPTPQATPPETLKDLAKDTAEALSKADNEAHPELKTATRPAPRSDIETHPIA